MADINTRFRGLLQRPYEPTFVPKNNGQLYYDVPDSYLTDHYRPFGAALQNRFGTNAQTRIPLPNITAPDLAYADVVGRRGGFSVFQPSHQRVAGQLIEEFLNQPNPDSLTAIAVFVRDRVNGPLFQYALSVALMHRTDTRDVEIPSFLELFPDRYIDPAVFPQLREEGTLVDQGDRRAIEIPMNFTASDRVDEQRLAYWR
uniref:Hemocyanin N-terminal domain-containing protein n=1 Tax=Anopheles maculatus TaxID=74869 RepID=A0A9I3K5D4_9DIPT